jgi:hypothetical protein
MDSVQDSSGLKQEPAAGSCKHSNEPSHSIDTDYRSNMSISRYLHH